MSNRITTEDPVRRELGGSLGCLGCLVWVVVAITLWWILFDGGASHIINALNHIGS